MSCISDSKKFISNLFQTKGPSAVIDGIFFLITLIISIVGIILILIGVLFANNEVLFITVVLGGVIWFVVGYLGYLSIIKQKVIIILTYAIVLVAVFILLLVFYILDDDSEDLRDVAKNWKDELKYPGSMDFHQTTFHCCGKNSPEDYFNILNRPLPISCYEIPFEITHKKGCLLAVKHFYAKGSSVSEWFYLTLLIVLFAFACYFLIRVLFIDKRGTNAGDAAKD